MNKGETCRKKVIFIVISCFLFTVLTARAVFAAQNAPTNGQVQFLASDVTLDGASLADDDTFAVDISLYIDPQYDAFGAIPLRLTYDNAFLEFVSFSSIYTSYPLQEVPLGTEGQTVFTIGSTASMGDPPQANGFVTTVNLIFRVKDADALALKGSTQITTDSLFGLLHCWKEGILVRHTTSDGDEPAIDMNPIYDIAEIVITLPPTEYSVNFSMQGHGVQIAPLNVTDGLTLNEPPEPVDDNYTFEGWFYDDAFTKAWDFAGDTVSNDMTLYAKWSAKPIIDPKEIIPQRRYCQVRYLVNNPSFGYISGEAVQILKEGDNANAVRAVAQEDCEFVRWSDGLESAERTDRNIERDLTYTAVFRKVLFVVVEAPAMAHENSEIVIAPRSGSSGKKVNDENTESTKGPTAPHGSSSSGTDEMIDEKNEVQDGASVGKGLLESVFGGCLWHILFLIITGVVLVIWGVDYLFCLRRKNG